MNFEDLKPCPICGARCSSISIDFDQYGFACGQRIDIYKGTFECSICGSTINISGDSAKQVFDKWNSLKMEQKAVQDAT